MRKFLVSLYFLPLCLLAVGIILFSLETVVNQSFRQDCRDGRSPYRFYDFCVYYEGGRLALSADRQSFYQPEIQHRYLADLRSSETDLLGDEILIMQYAPFVPVLMIPLAILPATLAFNLYLLGSYLAFVGGLYFVLLLLKAPPQTLQRFFIGLALLGTVPMFSTALLGQVSNYLFCLTAAYFYCLTNKKDKWAGLLLALCSFKPHYALFWAIPALAAKRWQILISAALLEILLLVLAIATLGWPAVLNYPTTVVKADTIASCSQVAIIMICLRGLLLALNPAGQGATLAFRLALPLMVAALIFVFILWRKKQSPPQQNLLIATTVIFCLFFSLHSYVYDAVLLIIPGLLIVFSDSSQKYSKRLLLAAPYIQWLGMVMLSINYHRSLPSALVLLFLTAGIIVATISKQTKKSDP